MQNSRARAGEKDRAIRHRLNAVDPVGEIDSEGLSMADQSAAGRRDIYEDERER